MGWETFLKYVQALLTMPKTPCMSASPYLRWWLGFGYPPIEALVGDVGWVEEVGKLQNVCIGM